MTDEEDSRPSEGSQPAESPLPVARLAGQAADLEGPAVNPRRDPPDLGAADLPSAPTKPDAPASPASLARPASRSAKNDMTTARAERRKQAPEPELSPTALDALGVARRKLADVGADAQAQRHRVMLGDDRVEVVLAQGPVAGHNGRTRNGKAWLATTPYLAWAPLPYETPHGGVAFACLGAGDEGCLFIDLAAAPGAIAIRGDRASAAHLAESLAHQLCRPAEDSSSRVILVGDVVPEPCPPGAVLAPTLRDLGLIDDAVPAQTVIVFCTLSADEDAFILARHVRRSTHRVVPVILGDLPGAPWSFSVTAQPAGEAND